MATRPELHIAVAKQKSKASEYNDNFDMMLDYIDDSLQESKDYVDGFMPDVTGQSGKFLTNDGTNTSWFNLFAANNTFTGNNTFSGNITISGGTFSFPKCTTKPTTTSTASNTLPAVVVENYLNGTSWYRVYSDGWIEQGGCYNGSIGQNASVTVTLLKSFQNTDYNALVSVRSTGGTTGGAPSLSVCASTKGKIIIINEGYAINTMLGVYWKVCGY